MNCLRPILAGASNYGNVLVWPVDNCYYNLNMYCNGQYCLYTDLQYQIQVGPSVYVDCRGCVFNVVAPSIYEFDPVYGWVPCAVGHCNPSIYWYFESILYMYSHTTLINITVTSTIPSEGITVEKYQNNVKLLYVKVVNLPAVYNNPNNSTDEQSDVDNSPGHFAIQLSGHITDIEIGWCTIFGTGYGIYANEHNITNIYIHDSIISNVSADGICLNDPYEGYNTSSPTYENPWQDRDWVIARNLISNTGYYELIIGSGVWTPLPAYSAGFGFSSANGMNVTIINNTFEAIMYNGIHLEAYSKFFFIINNTFSGIRGFSTNPAWSTQHDCIWMSYSYWVDIIGNTFLDCYNNAIQMQPRDPVYCAPYSGFPYGSDCIPWPPPLHYSTELHIRNNNFVRWGTGASECQSEAYWGGAEKFETSVVVFRNNSYNSYYGHQLHGSCFDFNSFIYYYHWPDAGLDVDETLCFSSPPNDPCVVQPWYTKTNSHYHVTLDIPTSAGTAIVSHFASLLINNTYMRSRPLSVLNDPKEFAIFTYPMEPWHDYSLVTGPDGDIDYAPGPHIAKGVGSIVDIGPFGQPGVRLTNAYLQTNPAFWPVNVDYSVGVVVAPSSAADGPIFGRVALRGGALVVAHGSSVAVGPTLTLNRGHHVIMTYTRATGAVSFYISGANANLNGTLTQPNTDISCDFGGGGFDGLIYDTAVFTGVLNSTDVFNLYQWYTSSRSLYQIVLTSYTG